MLKDMIIEEYPDPLDTPEREDRVYFTGKIKQEFKLKIIGFRNLASQFMTFKPIQMANTEHEKKPSKKHKVEKQPFLVEKIKYEDTQVITDAH